MFGTFLLPFRLFASVCFLSVAFFAYGGESESKTLVLADLDLEMIRVGAGTFVMGSTPDEPLRDKAEGPLMKVTLTDDFWLGKTEVTQAQYEAVVGVNPSRFTEVGSAAPVEEVSWKDAMKFCELLTERERAADRLPDGYEFTLPTEAQWEYACRAGTTTSYAGDPEAMAWFDENGDETTHLVAQLRPNNWGFYDMSGNVLEWCFDWYGNYPGGLVSNPMGPKHGYFRMARGGSWRLGMDVGRSAARSGGSEGRRDYTIGFRLALGVVR